MIAKKIEGTIFILLVVVCFLTPTFFLPGVFLTTQATSILFGFGISLMSLAWIIGALYSRRFVVPKSLNLIPIFLPIITYFLSSFLNSFSYRDYFGYAFEIGSVGFILFLFIYLYLIFVILNTKHKVFYAYFSFLSSILLLAVYLVSRFLIGPEFMSFGVFNSIAQTTIGSWNNTGIFIASGLLLSLVTLDLAPVSRAMRIFLVCTSILSVFILVAVNFSLIWGMLSFCLVVYSLFEIFQKGKMDKIFINNLKRVSIYTLVAVCVSTGLFFFGGGIGEVVQSKFGITNIEIRPSFTTTLNIIKKTLEQKPFFGFGPDGFIYAWRLWRPDEIIQTVFWNSNFSNGAGLIPTYAITSGVIGFLSWAIFLSYYIYVGLKSLFYSYGDSFLKYIAISSFYSSLFLWISCVVFVPSVVVYITTFFLTGVFLSTARLSGIISAKEITLNRNRKTGFVSSLILTFIFLGLISMSYNLYLNFKSLWYYQKASISISSGGDSDVSENYINKAISLVPHDIYYRIQSSIEINKLNQLLSNKKNNNIEEVVSRLPEIVSKAVNSANSAVRTDSKSYLNWLALGGVYESMSLPELKIKGAYEKSFSAYDQAFILDPRNPSIPLALSRLNLLQKKYEEAATFAKKSIDMKKDYLNAYYILSQIEIAEGNIDEAISTVTSSAIIDSTNPAIFFHLGVLYFSKENWKMAESSLNKAILLKDDYANAKYYLGLTYEKLGNHNKAIEQFEDLVRTNQGNNEILDILRKLKSGETIFNSIQNSQSLPREN